MNNKPTRKRRPMKITRRRRNGREEGIISSSLMLVPIPSPGPVLIIAQRWVL